MQDNILTYEFSFWRPTREVARTSWKIQENQTQMKVDLDPSAKHMYFVHRIYLM